MGDRGRNSGAQLSTVPVVKIERPPPPAELSEDQQIEWVEMIGSVPADWFGRENLSSLTQYCRHTAAARNVASLIDDHCREEADFDLEKYNRLLAMQERESRAINALLRSMRLTQQATYDSKKQRPSQGKRPWEA